MKRSKRIEALDARPVNLDGYINEWPEMGFIAMKSPYDPTPSVRVEDGKIVELDGKSREDFDFIDQFIADYAINIDRAENSMSVSSLEIARIFCMPIMSSTTFTWFMTSAIFAGVLPEMSARLSFRDP